jgi:hypothetical protein
MPAVGFEPAIPASERPQAHTLDRAATGNPRYTATTFGNKQCSYIWIWLYDVLPVIILLDSKLK